MALATTHLGYVEQWECDTNDHLNVRFYGQRFDEALAMLCAIARQPVTPLTCRHIRFHQELRADAVTRVRSGRVDGGPADGQIVHLLEDAESGALAASALDILEAAPDAAPAPADELTLAMPRGVPVGPSEAADTEAMLARGAAVVSNIRVARPELFDVDGRYRSYEFISAFSDGGVFAWHHAGLTNALMAEKGWGRVAVETKVTPLAPVEPGAVLRQTSWVTEVAKKSLAFAHQIDDMRTGVAVCRGDARVVALSFETRRTVELPDFVRPSV